MNLKRLREQLAKLAGKPAELVRAVPQIAIAPPPASAVLAGRAQGVGVLTARTPGGAALSAEQRDALLAKAVAGEYVELEIDILAYEQQTGVRNRNSVRFRDGAMMALGRSGRGTPFLRDHNQGSVLSRGGTILESDTKKLDEGHYQIVQTVKLTAPWAVELALRELLDSASIGWRPTGPILCSVCDEPVFSVCWHFPGDDLSEKEAKALGVDPATIVEWVYTDAELRETSGVNVGGVPTARIQGIRAAMAECLSEVVPDLRAVLADGGEIAGMFPGKEDMPPELLKLLGLAATASESEVLAAVKKLNEGALSDRAENAVLAAELKKHEGAIAQLEATERKRQQDEFVLNAFNEGKIKKGEEAEWRALYEANSARAVELMAAKKPGSATPVGVPPQHANDPERAPVITGGERISRQRSVIRKQLAAAVERVLADNKAAAYALHAFGFSDPDGRLAARVPTTLGATSITNDADLNSARTGFHAAFLEQLDTSDDMTGIGQIATEVPSNKRIERHNWMGDAPDFEEWTNDRKLAGLEVFKLTVENKKWASGLRVKNDDFKDDALGLIPPQIAQMAIRAKLHRFNMFVKLLQNGFDGNTYPEMGDGLAYDDAFFFSAAHRGGTAGNNGNNLMNVVLDSAGLEAAEKLLRKQRTYDGKLPYGARGTHLIVGPENEAEANRLMTQEYLIRAAGDGGAQSNYLKGKYKVVVADQIDLAHPLDWFLADLSGPIKPIMFQLREDISTSAIVGAQGTQNDSIPRFSYDELWFGAEARYNVAYFEHRRIVGSRSA